MVITVSETGSYMIDCKRVLFKTKVEQLLRHEWIIYQDTSYVLPTSPLMVADIR